MTVKCPEDVHRRFVAWCHLHGLTAQDVLVEFMKEKGDSLARSENKDLLKKPEKGSK